MYKVSKHFSRLEHGVSESFVEASSFVAEAICLFTRAILEWWNRLSYIRNFDSFISGRIMDHESHWHHLTLPKTGNKTRNFSCRDFFLWCKSWYIWDFLERWILYPSTENVRLVMENEDNWHIGSIGGWWELALGL